MKEHSLISSLAESTVITVGTVDDAQHIVISFLLKNREGDGSELDSLDDALLSVEGGGVGRKKWTCEAGKLVSSVPC